MQLPKDWQAILKSRFDLSYLRDIEQFLHKVRQEKTIYPPKEDIFNALKYTPFKETKVIIIGQDPYHNKGQAHGLAFSVQKGVRIPPSLLNIYKELKANYGYEVPAHGNLSKWAKQGVLLLNAILTVEAHQPMSHRSIGWQKLLTQIIEVLNQDDAPKVFVLWGNSAKKYQSLITNSNHLVLMSSHPSPLSARHSFFGSEVFLKINHFLQKHNRSPIDFLIE